MVHTHVQIVWNLYVSFVPFTKKAGDLAHCYVSQIPTFRVIDSLKLPQSRIKNFSRQDSRVYKLRNIRPIARLRLILTFHSRLLTPKLLK